MSEVLTAVRGVFQFAAAARSTAAVARSDDTGAIQVLQQQDNAGLHYASPEQFDLAAAIPGLPQEVLFADGSRFIPDDPNWRWPSAALRSRWLEWLENHWLAILAAALLVPFVTAWTLVKGVPMLSVVVADHVPEVVIKSSSSGTLDTLDATLFSPSTLSKQERLAVNQQWLQLADRAGLEEQRYQLTFRQWGDDDAVANAFALPDGMLVLTDRLVHLMEDDPDALNAVLLHEVGHVHHRHGIEMMAQSATMSLAIAMMLGSVDGVADVMLGAGVGLVQNGFSRDMEREADLYAFRKLADSGRDANDFARAMLLLQGNNRELEATAASEDTDNSGWLEESNRQQLMEYLSTHPMTNERIELARSIAHCQQEGGSWRQCYQQAQ